MCSEAAGSAIAGEEVNIYMALQPIGRAAHLLNDAVVCERDAALVDLHCIRMTSGIHKGWKGMAWSDAMHPASQYSFAQLVPPQGCYIIKLPARLAWRLLYLSVAPLVDEFPDGLQVGRSPGDVWLHSPHHVQCGLVDLHGSTRTQNCLPNHMRDEQWTSWTDGTLSHTLATLGVTCSLSTRPHDLTVLHTC